jgi:methionyl-tRNA formyltransferase
LLPRWRGAAPIQRAIEAGDSRTGITIMQMNAGLDTGDMLVTTDCAIADDDTGGRLHDRLLELGGPALNTAVTQLANASAQPEPQDDSQATYAAKMTKAEAELDFHASAAALERKIRAFNPFPVAFTRTAAAPHERLRVWAAEISDATDAEPGTVVRIDPDAVVVTCGERSLRLTELQLPGKRAMTTADVLRGRADLFRIGERFARPGDQP